MMFKFRTIVTVVTFTMFFFSYCVAVTRIFSFGFVRSLSEFAG